MMAFFYANALASQAELHTEMEQHLVTAADVLGATEEARRSGPAKSDFIARMSHELRAPLNASSATAKCCSKTPKATTMRPPSPTSHESATPATIC
jgi:hypothetical protein